MQPAVFIKILEGVQRATVEPTALSCACPGPAHQHLSAWSTSKVVEHVSARTSWSSPKLVYLHTAPHHSRTPAALPSLCTHPACCLPCAWMLMAVRRQCQVPASLIQSTARVQGSAEGSTAAGAGAYDAGGIYTYEV